MKIEKKHIIILIVAAVAVFLLWKKGVFGKSKSGASEDGSLVADTDIDLDYIYTHVIINGEERAKIEKLSKDCETNNSTRQQIQAKAYKNGLSFDQQICCEAIWKLYIRQKPNGENYWSDDRGWKLINEIKAL